MKKILLATTVLAATTGYAAAEVKTTASVRMGVVSVPAQAAVAASTDYEAIKTALADAKAAYAEDGADKESLAAEIAILTAALSQETAGTAAVGSKTAFSSRVRIGFSASGETDNGLTFGASVRNDQSGVGNTANGDSTVFISGAFGKLAMGDVSGAADAIVGQVSGVGYTSLGSTNEIGYLSNTKTAALYTYSAGALSFGLGLGQTTTAKQEMSVAAKYSTDAYSVAVGYEDTGAAHQTSVLGSASMSGVTVKAKVADNSTKKNNAYALSADYSMDAMGLTAFYTSDFAKVGSYGVGASYNLGGGATVRGGVAKTEKSKAKFDLGVNMSF